MFRDTFVKNLGARRLVAGSLGERREPAGHFSIVDGGCNNPTGSRYDSEGDLSCDGNRSVGLRSTLAVVDDDDVIARVNNSVKEWLARAQQYHDAGKKAEAKKMVANGQKELRAIKAEVVAEEREVRAQFAAAKLKTGQAGQTIGLFMNSKHRGQMARARAAGKRSIAQQQQDAMNEYRHMKAAIDSAVLQLDRIKQGQE